MKLNPTEHQFQSSLCKLLTVQARPDMIWFAIPNGGHRHIAVASMLKAEGVKRGIPDLAFLLPKGKTAWLELKVKKGRLSGDQKIFRDRAQELGHVWGIAKTWDEAMVFLAWIGALKEDGQMISTYVRHSPSALNLFCASPAMFVLERVLGLKQPVGVPAHRGVAVEDGVTHGLLNPEAPLKDCVDVAQTKYDTLTALLGDERREKYRGNIPDMVSQALAELRPYGIPSHTQGPVEWKPEGLTLPIYGIFDYHWAEHNITTDLKTTERMPSEVKINHAKQVALYVTSNNASPRITYATPKKCQTYNVDNIDAHRTALHQIALKVEKFLSLSDDPQFYVDITAPDLDSFYWTPPAARQMAFEVWGIFEFPGPPGMARCEPVAAL